MSISFFWLERGGRWGSSPSTSPANHQKLNVIQKWGFYFLAREGWQIGFESIDQLGRSSEVERNPKMSILFVWLERGGRQISSPSISLTDHQKLNVIQNEHFILLTGEGWQIGFKSINQLIRSSEVERNPKMRILFFWLERGGRWGLSPSTSLADHQKLNVIQKQAFYFFGWRGVADGFWIHRPARPIIRSWT